MANDSVLLSKTLRLASLTKGVDQLYLIALLYLNTGFCYAVQIFYLWTKE
ncbi:hypothetical protein NIES37_07690 [Tolypothrix tenuis PCC 7101]|uniref:Uncharacterized protein n=1 Tax=Tolypothrix tenuis PCC 7101 TaxID=231146 RepID=A0A1Z4MTN5_9CYAN|nr:hypothetical protein NIES37_07690 [Tolypothrix tenuis PCC 7101]BAZ72660.1 hypothetical protein NIES50_12140 [Aulosira laxa NIES-50]